MTNEVDEAIQPERDAPEEPYVHRGRPKDPEARAIARENPLRRGLRILGPGLISGAADDDPSGIGTYAQAGAAFGFATLWLTVLTLPFMIAVQFLCARIALVSGRGLAGTIRRHYPRPLLFGAVVGLLVVNVITAGADIGAMAGAVSLFAPIPSPVLIVGITVGLLMLQVVARYDQIARVFKWLALTLLAYVVAAVIAHPDAAAVLRGSLLPTISFDPAYIAIVVAVMGTTINPYLFFWQAGAEVEDQMAKGRHRLWQREGATDTELRYRAWDVGVGMFFSQFVAFFIIVATGATLHAAGKTNIGSVADAAQALTPLVGPAATLLFSIGIIGTGVLAVPVLTASSAYALSETFDWPYGLNASPARAPLFYGAIVLGMVAAMGFNFLGINPIEALVLASVVSGLLTPPILVLLMLIGNNRAVMGERTNGRVMNVMVWGMTAIMTIGATALIVTTLIPH